LVFGAVPGGSCAKRVQFSPLQRKPITQPLISSFPDGSIAIFEL
jgi:hypothetical protein